MKELVGRKFCKFIAKEKRAFFNFKRLTLKILMHLCRTKYFFPCFNCNKSILLLYVLSQVFFRQLRLFTYKHWWETIETYHPSIRWSKLINWSALNLLTDQAKCFSSSIFQYYTKNIIMKNLDHNWFAVFLNYLTL